MSNAVGSKLHSPLAAEPKRNTANRQMRNIFKLFWQFVKPLLREVVSRLWSSRPAGVTVYNGSLQALSPLVCYRWLGISDWELQTLTGLKALSPPLIGCLSCHLSLLYRSCNGSASTHRTRALVIIIASNNTEEDFGRVCKSNFSSAMTWKLKKSN